MNLRAWAEQVVEAPLHPERPIIDVHHHLWADAGPEGFGGPYPYDRLVSDISDSGHLVIGTVFIDSRAGYRTEGPEAMRPLGETAFAQREAEAAAAVFGRAPGICAGIISSADMLLGSRIAAVLDAHMALSPRFRGIRYMTAFDASLPPVYGATEPGLMDRPEFHAAFAEVDRRGLSFDAWLFYPQMPELVRLAAAFPGARIVLDHTGGGMDIGRSAERRAAWQSNLAAAAACPNIVLKLGGLNSSFTGLGAAGEAAPRRSEEVARIQRDTILTAIDLFGTDRCMFESNFPVDMTGASYGVIWNSFKRMTADFSSADRRRLFCDNAMRIYRI